jgi:FdhD protein
MMDPIRVVARQVWRRGSPSFGSRSIPEETAVALTYNGGTYAVMMATPRDLEEFAVGFSLNEGVVGSPADICSLEVLPLDDGVELRMWLSQPKADQLRERRRHIAGPTGCGLCGVESIGEAIRPAAVVGIGRQFSAEQIMVAMHSLPSRQKLNIETRAVHAAPFGPPRPALLPCARTSDVITRSTSCRVHWRGRPSRQARGSFSSPAGCRSRWCRRAPRWALP